MTGFTFDLGERVVDHLTEFEGVVTVRSEHLTGCNRYCVRPAETDDGEYPDSTWFDEQRLESKEGESKSRIRKIFEKTKENKPGSSGKTDKGKPTP